VPTTAIGLGTLLAIVVGTRTFPHIPGLKRVPAPLVAMLLAMLVQAIFRFPHVATIGSAFGGIPRTLPSFSFPDISLSVVFQLIGPAFAIAMLGAIESLLTAVVADGMIGTRHDSNQELIGQGAANLLSPLFGGFAATGAIARTATNIRNGATSPVAGVVHAAFLVLVIVVLAPWASAIPLCALAAILFYVAWNMADLPHVSRLLRRSPRSDKVLLLTTLCLTVFFDLVIAVNVGVILAALLFMRRMANAVNVDQEDAEALDEIELPANVLVYRIDGPFFFGAAVKLERTLERVQTGIDTVVLRLGRVPFIDVTGLQTLSEVIERFHKRHVKVILCGIHAGVVNELADGGVLQLVGERNVCRNLQQDKSQTTGSSPAPRS
jgi:SulP family sulfate permease